MAKKVDDQEVFVEARAALAAFKRMAPQLTMYARTIAGKHVFVKPGAMTMTDGKNIFVRPPLALAKKYNHDYHLCEVYDERNMSMCDACATRENIIFLLQHEIAHVAHGSFKEFKYESEFQDVVGTTLIRLLPDLEKNYAALTVAMLNGHVKADTTLAAINGLGDKHLATLMLFLEDIRINEASYKVRPGLRKIAHAHEQDTLDNGIEMDDGGHQPWSEAALDMQICAAILFASQGHNITGRLHIEALDVVEDPTIVSLIAKIKPATGTLAIALIGIELLARIRELGYMIRLEEEDEEGKGEGNGEGGEGESQSGSSSGMGSGASEPAGSDGESGSSGKSDGSTSDYPSDQDSGESEGKGDDEADNEEGSDNSEGDGDSPRRDATAEQLEHLARQLLGHSHIKPTDEAKESGEEDNGKPTPAAQRALNEALEEAEQLLSKVIGSAWALDHIPRNINGIEVFKRGEGKAYHGGYYGDHRSYRANEPTPEAILGASVMQARVAFSNNARIQHYRNQRSGKLAQNVLGKRAALGDDRLFGKKISPDKRNYHVLIGLDISYSTAGPNIEHIKHAARALGDVCARVGVGFSVYAHSTEEARGSYADSDVNVAIYEVKNEKDPWDNKTQDALANLAPVSGNLDGHTMQFYRKQLDKVRATDKVLMYFTDGKMPASNYEEELMVLQQEIEECKRRRITLLGVGINTVSPREHGLDTVGVYSNADYPLVVKHLSKMIIKTGA